MKTRKIIFTLLLAAFSLAATAQDIIILRNGEEIKSVVQKVGANEIEYKKFSNATGPSYTISKSEVFMIMYKNGEKDVFKDDAPQSTPVQTQPQSTQPAQTPQPAPAQAAQPAAAVQPDAQPSTTDAVSNGWKPKKTVISVGMGLDSRFNEGGFETEVPPFVANYDFKIMGGLLDNKAGIWAGVVGGLTMSTFDIPTPAGGFIETYHFLVGARGLFQYNFIDRLDTYGGLLLGYYMVSVESNREDVSASASEFAISFVVGARFWLMKNFGVMAEFNHNSMANITVGIAIGF